MEYTLKVTADEVNLIWAALGKLPYEHVAKFVTKLQKQVNEQTTIDLSNAEVVKEEIKEEVEE